MTGVQMLAAVLTLGLLVYLTLALLMPESVSNDPEHVCCNSSFFSGVLMVLAKPLGEYMGKVFEFGRHLLDLCCGRWNG